MFSFTKANVFLIICISFIIGIGVRSLAVIPLFVLYSVSLCGLCISILGWKQQKLRYVGLCVVVCIFGILYYQFQEPDITKQHIAYYNGETVRFGGVVAQEPDVRSNHQKLTINVQQGMENAPIELEGSVLVKTELYPPYQYGDYLDITCTIQKPEPLEFETEAGVRVFEYDKYLARYDIYSVCYRPHIAVVGHEYGNVLLAGLLNIKSQFVGAIQKVLAEPHASFLGGLVLGAKKAIPEDLMENFNRTGTTHIVALSGYNITIIAILVLNLCKHFWISRRGAFWVSLFAITFFVLITGAQASVVRAGIMGMLVLLATQLGRMSRITNTLALAAFVMVLINPKVLVFDAGFQLSFLATMGLVYLSPILERGLKRIPNIFELRMNLVATMSATIATLPLILFQFGRLSTVALLVNMLILPLIPVAMGVGFLMGIFSLIWLPLGQLFAWVAWAILSYVIVVVETFAKFNFASLEIAQVSWMWLWGGYGLLVFIIFKLRKRSSSLSI